MLEHLVLAGALRSKLINTRIREGRRVVGHIVQFLRDVCWLCCVECGGFVLHAHCGCFRGLSSGLLCRGAFSPAAQTDTGQLKVLRTRVRVQALGVRGCKLFLLNRIFDPFTELGDLLANLIRRIVRTVAGVVHFGIILALLSRPFLLRLLLLHRPREII